MVHIYQEAREVLGSFCLSLNAMMIEDCMRNAGKLPRDHVFLSTSFGVFKILSQKDED